MREKDEYALVLDYLPYGYPLEGKMNPIVQAIDEKYFSLLELVPSRGMTFNLQEKVYIGPNKRDKIYFIRGRLATNKLTETAKIQLQEFVKKVVAEQEKKYLDFFNTAQAINTRLHRIELLPGFGKKHTNEIIKIREEKPFESFDDIRERAPGLPDPQRAIEKRIIEEILESPRQRLFVI